MELSALPDEVMNKLTTFASIREFFEKNVRFSYNAYTPSKKSESVTESKRRSPRPRVWH